MTDGPGRAPDHAGGRGDNDGADEAETQLVAQYSSAFRVLCYSARGQDVVEAERLVRDFASTYQPHAREVELAFTARALSDPRWGRKHPMSAVALAWRHRGSQRMRRSLRWLWSPRIAG